MNSHEVHHGKDGRHQQGLLHGEECSETTMGGFCLVAPSYLDTGSQEPWNCGLVQLVKTPVICMG